MRIAILGAGLAGLATAWFITKKSKAAITVDIFDPIAVGMGTSGLSSGMLHTFPGRRGRKAWKASSGLRDAHITIGAAAEAIGTPLIRSRGILRPAISEKQREDFLHTAREHDEVIFWERKKCEETVEGLVAPLGGLFIKDGLTLDVSLYLSGLWKAIALMGGQFHQKEMLDTKDFEPYDRVLFATGPETLDFLEDLPITPVKGQLLELQWPETIAPLPHSVAGAGYLVMGKSHKTCIAGATFEREFASKATDAELARELIMNKIAPIFPSLVSAPILGARAGVRASGKNHLPLLGRVNEKFWFFTGLGSKGLLYHAWLGKRMCYAMIDDKTIYLPEDLDVSY